MIILRNFTNINVKQFFKFKIHVFEHLIRKKIFFRLINNNVFMRKMINNLIIKTQIPEIMQEKFDHRKKKKFTKKSR